MQHLNVSLVQYDIIWEESNANLEYLDDLLETAQGSDLIILPEMFNTGFSMDAAAVAQNGDGQAVSWLCARSGELETTIMGSVAIREDGCYYNRCYVASEGEIIAQYDKRNCFTYAGEEKIYTPGEKQVIFELNGWKVKPLICYDLRFPLWCYNRQEADLMIFVANWPESRVMHWDALLQARAIENQAFVIGVNRIGTDGTGKSHNGHSAVVGPYGNYISEPLTAAGVFNASLDPSEISRYRSMFHLLEEERMRS